MSRRVLRINELVKRELNQVFLREIDFAKDIFVTISKVETSSNLFQAKVYISVVPDKEQEGVFKILNRQIYSIQQELNKRLGMRPVPKIRFMEERKIMEAGKIEDILASLKKS